MNHCLLALAGLHTASRASGRPFKNKIEIPISKFLYFVILLVAYASVLINSFIIYFNEEIPQLADIVPWIMSFKFLVLLTGFTLFFAWILSSAKWRPSGFFILFYSYSG